jgi:hypothetical protein
MAPARKKLLRLVADFMAAILILLCLHCPVLAQVIARPTQQLSIARQPSHPAGATMSQASRRAFLKATGAAAIASSLPMSMRAAPLQSSFRVAVISDEISHDFDHACSVIANDFGLQWVELRGLWDKNIMALHDDDIAKANAILDKYKLRVTDIASPLFKVDWPEAPISKYSPMIDKKSDTFGASFAFQAQHEILQKSIALAKQFKTDRVRCFDFWRIEDQAPYRKAIDAKLLEAAAVANTTSSSSSKTNTSATPPPAASQPALSPPSSLPASSSIGTQATL